MTADWSFQSAPVGRGAVASGGVACLTLLVQHMVSSKVANAIAKYNGP